MWPTVPLHRASQKLQCSLAIPAFRGKDLERLTFMINGPPEIVRLTIDRHEHLVQMPAPLRITPVLDTPLLNLGSKNRTEPVPPEPHRLMADIDATLEKQIFDLAQR
jgi:hypothetical protein